MTSALRAVDQGVVFSLHDGAWDVVRAQLPKTLLVVNVCRVPCGFCQSLAPRYQQLAKRMQHVAAVGYWDIDLQPNLPVELNKVNSTPSIIALVPRPLPHSPSWDVIPYMGPREPDDMFEFMVSHMPSRIQSIDHVHEWNLFIDKQDRRSRVVVFLNRSRAAASPSILRALSIHFEAKFLFGLVRLHPSDVTQHAALLAKRFDVSQTPSFIALRSGDNAPKHLKVTTPSYGTLRRLFEKHLKSYSRDEL